jgi:hypothetical protein
MLPNTVQSFAGRREEEAIFRIEVLKLWGALFWGGTVGPLEGSSFYERHLF